MLTHTCKNTKKNGKVTHSHQLVETLQTEKGPRTRILFWNSMSRSFRASQTFWRG
ncbi:MAG: hypothetical protein M1537_03020 [Nitrospirae bacterium]|nr:hypothetical protein [Nitrospirota bacterium]MCL5286071.1 hypothetical protein [Nitrospirota bacterium]